MRLPVAYVVSRQTQFHKQHLSNGFLVYVWFQTKMHKCETVVYFWVLLIFVDKRHGAAGQGRAGQDRAGHGRHGTARHGTARHGAGHGTARQTIKNNDNYSVSTISLTILSITISITLSTTN
jgi:hypothetical protein